MFVLMLSGIQKILFIFIKLLGIKIICILVSFCGKGSIINLSIFSSKSIKIGFMPMAKELAKRGHKIYVVSPYKGISHKK